MLRMEQAYRADMHTSNAMGFCTNFLEQPPLNFPCCLIYVMLLSRHESKALTLSYTRPIDMP